MKKLILAILLMGCPAYAQYYGTFPQSSVIDYDFTTRSTTGAPTSLAGGGVSCYKSNSTTESTTGVTLTADFDGRTGLNHLRVDLSSDTTFYSAQANISCVITAGLVGSSSVIGEVVLNFRITNDFTLQKNVAFSNFPIWMLSASGAAQLGLTPACQIAKDGGAWSTTANVATEVGLGKYVLNLTANETNANVFTLICTGGSALSYRTNVTPQQ